MFVIRRRSGHAITQNIGYSLFAVVSIYTSKNINTSSLRAGMINLTIINHYRRTRRRVWFFISFFSTFYPSSIRVSPRSIDPATVRRERYYYQNDWCRCDLHIVIITILKQSQRSDSVRSESFSKRKQRYSPTIVSKQSLGGCHWFIRLASRPRRPFSCYE